MRGKSLLVLASLILLTVGLLSRSYGETVYFVVGEIDPNRNESYVLPITDANDIAHARDLIKYGPGIGQPLVVAEIECGADWINRNYLSPMKAPWGWHVTEFNDFADVTAEVLDGGPTFVQNDCQGWMDNTNGYIGFWSFTVVAELGTNPDHWERDFGSDGKVNGKDYAWLGGYWMDEDCNGPSWCGGSDLDESNSVDYNDLRIFGESWLSPFAEEPIWLGWWYEQCWDNPRQCHGDADGQKEGSVKTGYWYVGTDDLDILNIHLGTSYGDFFYNPHADFDRDGDVDYDDGDILIRWYGVKEPPRGSGVPADCPTWYEYTLTIDTNGGGSVSVDPNQAAYHYGTEVTLTADPNTGWLFDFWSGDLTGSANPDTIIMSDDKMVTANFILGYTLTISTVGEGWVIKNPDQAGYSYGTEVTLIADPNTGWSFSEWSGDLTGSTNPDTITMDANMAVTATFTQDE